MKNKMKHYPLRHPKAGLSPVLPLLLFMFISLLGFTITFSQTINIPDGISVVRGIKVGFGDPCNKDKDDNPSSHWGEAIRIWQFAEVCIEKGTKLERDGLQKIFNDLATKSGHPEIKHAPIITNGFSWSSGNAYAVTKAFPERIVATVLSGITVSPDEGTLKLPLSIVCNEGDAYERCLNIVNKARAKGAPWAAASRFNGFHGWYNSSVWLFQYVDYFVRTRIPLDKNTLNGPIDLIDIDITKAWLGFRDERHRTMTPRIMPAEKYLGLMNNTYWFPNEGIARAWQSFSNLRDGLYEADTWNDYPYYRTGPYKTTEGSPSVYMYNPAWSLTIPGMYNPSGMTQIVGAYSNGQPLKEALLYDGSVQVGKSTQVPHIAKFSHALATGYHPMTIASILQSGDTLAGAVSVAGIRRNSDLEIKISEPNEGERVTVGSSVKIKATLGTAGASKVELWVDGAMKEESSKAPFEFTWSASGVGEHILELKAFKTSNETFSWPVKISVVDNSVASGIVIQPSENWVKPNESVTYKAIVLDQYGYPMKNPPAVNWAANEGGTITSGVFKGTKMGGPYSVSASIAGIKGEAKAYVSNRIRVNFQPDWAVSPAGFLVDAGKTYGSQDKGMSYGWNSSIRHERQRLTFAGIADQYTTFLPMHGQYDPPYNRTYSNSIWEIAIPNGTYMVHLVAGDMLNQDDNMPFTLPQTKPEGHVYKINVENVLVVDGLPTHEKPWVEGWKSVTVSDGKLTVSNATGQNWNKIDFIEIIPPDDAVSLANLKKNSMVVFPQWSLLNGKWTPLTALPSDAKVSVNSITGAQLWRGAGREANAGIPVTQISAHAQFLMIQIGEQRKIEHLIQLK